MVTKKLTGDLEAKKKHIERIVNINDAEQAGRFFNCSGDLVINLKKKYSKMPFEWNNEGFRCKDTVEMLRFWVSFNRERNKTAVRGIVYWWESDPNFAPFLQDIPPLSSYK